MVPFRGGLVFKARILLYHSTPGARVIILRVSRPVAGLGFRKDRIYDSADDGGELGVSFLLRYYSRCRSYEGSWSMS